MNEFLGTFGSNSNDYGPYRRKIQFVHVFQITRCMVVGRTGKIHLRQDLCSYGKTFLAQSKPVQFHVLGRSGHGRRA